MYERLPLDFIGITDKFGYRKDPTEDIQQFHYGVDFGWHSYQGEPVYAIHDSTIVYESYDVNLGNYVVLSYEKENNTIIYRFLHLKDRVSLKQGDKVLRGQVVGYMGTTGDSTGVHLHFEYWICPKDYNYYYGDRSTYAVDPLKYCYLFNDQEAASDTIPYLIKVVGTTLVKEKNDEINQIEVLGNQLRCRTGAGLTYSVLGYIDYGIYDILETKINDNYTWYRISDNKWIAGVKDDVIIYNTKVNILDIENFYSFTATKDDYYYVYLKENETIYFSKN